MSMVSVAIAVGASVAGAATSAALKPKAPKPGVFTPIDAQVEQQKAISGNVSSLPQINALARRTNDANQAETDRLFPWFAKLRDKGVSNSYDFMSGKIPDDVSNAVQRSGASKALGGGYAYGSMRTNLVARDLGLTSLDLMGRGDDSASKWTALSKSMSSQFDITSMFLRPPTINPQQERNDELRYANDAARFNYVNDPWNEFQSKTADTFGQALQGFLGGGFSTDSTIAKYDGSSTFGPYKLGKDGYYG